MVQIVRPTLSTRRASRHLAPLAALGLSLAAAGCSGDVNPMKAAFVGAGYGPKAVDAPSFVQSSRRPGADYMPVGQDAPRRDVRARSAEAQRSLEADLEDARTRNEARGRTAEGAARGIAQGIDKGRKPAEPPTP